MSTTEAVFNTALSLTSPERAELAHRLLLSLDEDGYDADWESAWAAEIDDRLAAVDRGEYEAVGRHEAIAEIRRSLVQGRGA